ncbi:MAG: hypothetical protein CVT92_01945 [Bacteroidetes bacterium HGW-Bacteroidetes-1]|jgi:hypothetical protein|nr:MAG: hypothetical protein CVT92_01945 [Bacteroidetes bacterium HGW-Bacteroidetes-1]
MIKAKILFIAFLLVLSLASAFPQNLLINEIMSSNSSTIADEDGDNSDWIELHNISNETIHLGGYGLSDDIDQPFRWIFPQKNIEPNGYLLIWTSGKNRINSQQPLHTNFSISSEGEKIILTNPDGQLVDMIDSIAIQSDISYGRLLNQTEEWRFFSPSSPGTANNETGYLLLLHAPTTSHTSGFYSQPFQLSISTNTPDAIIVFTTDGSIPDLNSNIYSSPIIIQSRVGEANTISMIPTNNNPDPGPPYYEGWQPPLGEVFKINVIRARVLHQDAPPGPVSSLSFLVDTEANQRYSLPVFSLTTNNDNLFDDEIGIYVHGNYTNYFQDGIEWERTANLSMIETDGSVAFTENIGIQTHGNTSRSRPRKSLRVIARAEYGNSWINYQLFPDKNTDIFKRFILRNSGNDWDMSIFRDAMLQSLARNLDVDHQFYRPAILFINGEYWGIHNVRERYDEHYIFAEYGIEEMEMTILENNSQHKFGNPSGTAHYNSMRSFVSTNNLAVDANFETLSTRMDIESFTDFQLAHILAMNTDWPGNNTLFWRYLRNNYDPNALNGRDGLWRWMLLDMDFGFGLNFNYVPGAGTGASHNTLAFALANNGPGWPNPPWSTFLLRNMVKNENYKQHFINRFCDLLNTDFKESKVVAVIDSIKNMLQPEMLEHINRWRRPISLNEWTSNIQVMRSFAQQRPSFIRQFIKSQFNLDSTALLTIQNNTPEMGTVQVNTIETGGLSWQGIYFTQIPIELEAHPKHGFRFVSWSGYSNSQSEKIDITMSSNTIIRAIFEVSNDFPGDSMNPQAYRLANGPYSFTCWDENNPEGQFPPHMIFQQSSKDDPSLSDQMTNPYHIPQGEYHADDAGSIGFPYRLTRRTRINGLGNEGISLINTGRGRDLGAAVLAVDTRAMDNITVSWKGGTIIPNSRAYAIRLQYRTDIEDDFTDVMDENGDPVEYYRRDQVYHQQVLPLVTLPEDANNQAYLQLRWKYYYTGQQIDLNDGSRDMLMVDNIVVSTVTMDVPERNKNTSSVNVSSYPNPFSEKTEIIISLSENATVIAEVFNQFGVQIGTLVNENLMTGTHIFTFDGSHLPAGNYFCVVRTAKNVVTRKILLLK